MSGEVGNQLVIQPESKNDPLTFELHQRTLDVYPLTDAELTSLSAGSESLNVGFFGICVAAAISFGTTLITVQLSDRTFAVYVALAVVAALGTFYFGIRTRQDRSASKALLKSLREKAKSVRSV